MAAFSSFQDTLPDPNNSIGDAGQETGSAGPGYASVELTSENKNIRSRTNSGRLISRSIAYHAWNVKIAYNPMTRADFENIYNFLIHRRGSMTPFFVSIPQYRLAQNASFVVHQGTGATPLIAAGNIAAGATSALIGRSGYNSATNGTPEPGDLFNISGANSNHKKAYMVTRVETYDDYLTGTQPASAAQIRVHFTPGLAKSIAASDAFVFYNPKIKVIANDIQSYSLGSNGLYQFGLQLEEVQ